MSESDNILLRELLDIIANLREEIEVLKQYGNKDCTAMAYEALAEIREQQ